MYYFRFVKYFACFDFAKKKPSMLLKSYATLFFITYLAFPKGKSAHLSDTLGMGKATTDSVD